MKLPIGYDNFADIIEKKLDFVDKTLFIKEVVDDRQTFVAVITRPRRFGKTTNLSMLQHFLTSEINGVKTRKLFDRLKITKIDGGEYMQHQGRYPVIFISFKEIKSENFELAYERMQLLLVRTFNEHSYLLQSDRLNESDRAIVRNILFSRANRAEITDGLRFLSSLLFKHYGVKPWLLIDEYDTPIQCGYLNGYYDEIINLMRGMFSAALKTNHYLERSIITGILRISKESLFSDLNNVKVYSVLNRKYGNCFGFTEDEVANVLQQCGLADKSDAIKHWYNGYNFGNAIIYNPWSIANCVAEDGMLKPYWINTSDNKLIRALLVRSTIEFKEQFQPLLQGKTVIKNIDENMVFSDLINNHLHAAWSLMLMSGYLKAISASYNEMGKLVCECAIPNHEVKTLFCSIIEIWLGAGDGGEWYENFMYELLRGNIEVFTAKLGQILLQTISVHDLAHNPEAFYHGFMLGLSAGLDPRKYEIKSNRESGLGRYDIAIMPKDVSQLAIVIEIKSLAMATEEDLEFAAQNALTQIYNKQYLAESLQRGFTKICKIGLAFSGKEFRVAAAQ